MSPLQSRSRPYIWVTWLTKLLVGENSCEWAAWFRTHYQDYQTVPDDFDSTAWQIKHTDLLNRVTADLEAKGQQVFTEGQNRFILRGNVAALAGKPDLLTVSGSQGTIYDAKTGKQSPSHDLQVMTYMWTIPKALGRFKDVTFDGKVVYENHEVTIPASAIDQQFTNYLTSLIKRVAAASPARKVPSDMECRFCNITKADCPERVTGETVVEGRTSEF